MDRRPYLYSYIAQKGGWVFVPVNTNYVQDMYPFEYWEIKNKKLILSRVVYTKEKANMFQKKNKKTNLPGPELYTVTDTDSNKIIATVRKPIVPVIEIGYDNGCEQLNETSSMDDIRKKLIEHFENVYDGKITPGRLVENITNFNHVMV